MSLVEQLIEMGFAKADAEAASVACDNLEGAIEWIITNESNSGGRQSDPAANPEASSAPAEAVGIPSSYKCDDCGKLLKNEDEIMFHATKTKHENFSESSEKVKDLTPEEKAQKVAELRKKIQAHRAKKDAEEAEENRKKEIRRREDGKAMIAFREEQKKKEALEALNERKREKLAEQEAKKRVLEQIKADREARKAKLEGESKPQAAPAPAPSAPAPSAPPKDYSSTTIQIRLLDGSQVKEQFKAKEPLSMVRAWIQTNHANDTPFSIMTPFPRKVFSDLDMDTPLDKLDLVPSANIVLTRK